MYVIKRSVEYSKPILHRYAIFLCSLDYLTRPKKSSWATNYSNMNGGHSLILSNGVNMTFSVSFHLPQDYVC